MDTQMYSEHAATALQAPDSCHSPNKQANNLEFTLSDPAQCLSDVSPNKRRRVSENLLSSLTQSSIDSNAVPSLSPQSSSPEQALRAPDSPLTDLDDNEPSFAVDPPPRKPSKTYGKPRPTRTYRPQIPHKSAESVTSSSSEEECLAAILPKRKAQSNSQPAKKSGNKPRSHTGLPTKSATPTAPAPRSTNSKILKNTSEKRKNADSLAPPTLSQFRARSADEEDLPFPDNLQDNWDLDKIYGLAWIAIGEEQGKFWWPTKILKSRLNGTVKCSLFTDSGGEISSFSSPEVNLSHPSSEQVVSYRGSKGPRFIRASQFKQNPSTSSPSRKAFEEAVYQAFCFDAEDNDGLPDADAVYDFGAASIASTQRTVEPSEEEDVEPEPMVREGSADSVADEDPEYDSLITIDTVGLAQQRKSDSVWWPARVVEYRKTVPKSKSKRGSPPYRVQLWPPEGDKFTYVNLYKEDFIRETDDRFLQVKLGSWTSEKMDSDIDKTVLDDMLSLAQRVIDGDYEPAKSRHQKFVSTKAHQRSKAVGEIKFGNFVISEIEAVTACLSEWFLGSASKGNSPASGKLTDSMAPNSKVLYISEVLLPVALITLLVDAAITTQAKDALSAKGSNSTPAELEQATFDLAEQEISKIDTSHWGESVKTAYQAVRISMMKFEDKTQAGTGRRRR